MTVSASVYGGSTGSQGTSTVVGSVYGQSTQSGGFTVMGAQSTGNITIALATGSYTVYATSYKQMYYGLCKWEEGMTVTIMGAPATDPGTGNEGWFFDDSDEYGSDATEQINTQAILADISRSVGDFFIGLKDSLEESNPVS